jgi:hypothetical protein
MGDLDVTHDHCFPVPQLLWFGFGWLGRERKLEVGHVGDESMCVLVEESGAEESGAEGEAGERNLRSKNHEEYGNV